MPFCKFKNINVFYTDEGKGRALVFLHGFLANHEVWNDFKQPFIKSNRVITIDLLGHGKSNSVGYIHAMELYAKSIKAVLRNLKIKKCVLVGHSLGGYVSLAFADLFPDNINGFCLLHSTAYADNETKKQDRLKAIELIKVNPKHYVSQLVNNLFYSKTLKYFKKEVTLIKKMGNTTSIVGMVNAQEGMRCRTDRDIILKLAPYPIMMVIGEQDMILPKDILLEQAKLIEKSTIVTLQDVGHMGFIEHSTIIIKTLKKFLRQCAINKIC